MATKLDATGASGDTGPYAEKNSFHGIFYERF